MEVHKGEIRRQNNPMGNSFMSPMGPYADSAGELGPELGPNLNNCRKAGQLNWRKYAGQIILFYSFMIPTEPVKQRLETGSCFMSPRLIAENHKPGHGT